MKQTLPVLCLLKVTVSNPHARFSFQRCLDWIGLEECCDHSNELTTTDLEMDTCFNFVTSRLPTMLIRVLISLVECLGVFMQPTFLADESQGISK